MKKKTFDLLLTLVAAMTMTSCGTYYFPQSARMPLMSQRGELVVDVNVPLTAYSTVCAIEDGLVANSWWYNASVAFAFADHWAAQLSSRNNDLDIRHEAMVGRFWPINNDVTLEVYGGYGYARCTGFQQDSYGGREWTRQGNAQTLFVQGDIGLPSYKTKWSGKCAFTAGFGLRMGGLMSNYVTHYYAPPTNDSNGQWVEQEETRTTPGQCWGVELEPTLKLGVGGERLKCEAWGGWSWISATYVPNNLPWNVNLTLSYRIPLTRSK